MKAGRGEQGREALSHSASVSVSARERRSEEQMAALRMRGG